MSMRYCEGTELGKKLCLCVCVRISLSHGMPLQSPPSRVERSYQKTADHVHGASYFIIDDV